MAKKTFLCEKAAERIYSQNTSVKCGDLEVVIKALNFEAHGFKRIKKCRRRDSNPYAKYLARDFKSLVSAIPPLRR